MKSQSSFTLIELLIVMGILAILGVTIILVLNPAEYLRQSRDSQRMEELSTINRALGYYQADAKTSFGNIETVYVSIPDSSPTCDNLGLPELPGDWSYHCSNSADYRKTNGAGWIPVDFTSISWGAPIEKLPTDPINTASTGNYYTYVTGGSWELTSELESDKYSNVSANDNDSFPGVYSVRTSASPITPGTRDKGLVGYWKFDEGSGSTAYDSSGNNNNGTLQNNPTWTTGKVGDALGFNGSNTNVRLPNTRALDPKIGNYTWSGWLKFGGFTGAYRQIYMANGGGGGPGVGLNMISNANVAYFEVYGSSGGRQTAPSFSITNYLNEWHMWTFILTSSDYKVRIYADGNLINTAQCSNWGNISSNSYLYFGSHGGYTFYYDGFIDDVRVYNRALSNVEISAIYNATK